MKLNRAWYVALALLAVAAAAVLYLFAPDQHRFYPRCLFYALTGWQCPGCGGLRAMHSLLHGNVGAAFTYNPLLVSLVPVALGTALWLVFQKSSGKSLRLPIKPLCLWLLLGVGVVFAVVRNLPGALSL